MKCTQIGAHAPLSLLLLLHLLLPLPLFHTLFRLVANGQSGNTARATVRMRNAQNKERFVPASRL